MAPFKSSLARSAGKSFGVYNQQDLLLRGVVPEDVRTSDTYLFIPLNENSTSHTLFGQYSSSLTTTSGGTYNTNTHPYAISDSTYNSGNSTSYRCEDACDVFRITNTNTILGSLGTSDFCCDLWWNWRVTGNGAGSYGSVGDSANGQCSGIPSTTNSISVIGTSGSLRYNIQPTPTGTRNLTGNYNDLNVWYHYMMIRQSGIFYIFVNGILNLVNSSDTSLGIFNNGQFNFGNMGRSDDHYWDVNLSDFMFTREDARQYTVNNITSADAGTTFFTPPEYKNKIMSESLSSKFVKSKRPTGFN